MAEPTVLPEQPPSDAELTEIERRTDAAWDWAWDDTLPADVVQHFRRDVPRLIGSARAAREQLTEAQRTIHHRLGHRGLPANCTHDLCESLRHTLER